MENQKNEDFNVDDVEEFTEAQGNFAKFEKPGDSIIGTFIGKVDIAAKGIYPAQIGYNLVVDGAEVTCAFNLSKKWVHAAMKSAKYGQRVKFLFDDWFETAEYKEALNRLPEADRKPENVKISRAKTIKVFLGRLDRELLDGFSNEVQEEQA